MDRQGCCRQTISENSRPEDQLGAAKRRIIMAVLAIGSTGHVGMNVVPGAKSRCRSCSARAQAQTRFPLRGSHRSRGCHRHEVYAKSVPGHNTVFLRNPVMPDELNRAILCVNLAMEARIERVVYFPCSMVMSSWIALTQPRNMRPS